MLKLKAITLAQSVRCWTVASARRLRHDASGLALIEFAYVLPILLGFGLVGLEFTNVVLAHQKTERVASTIADLVASNQVPPNERQIGDMFASVPIISKPFVFNEESNVVITAVVGIYDSDDDEVQNKVAWQRCLRADAQSSAIGNQWNSSADIADGPEVSLPNSIALGQNQMVIVAEVFFAYQPIISQSLVKAVRENGELFTETSTYRTRGQSILNITPVSGVDEHVCSQ